MGALPEAETMWCGLSLPPEVDLARMYGAWVSSPVSLRTRFREG